MITRTKMCLIALAVIGSVVSSSTGAVAEDDLEPPPSAETGRIDPAAEYMQQAYGISRTEAERRLQLQVPLASLDEELKTTDGQAFGGLWIDQADGGRVVLATTGDGGALLEKVRARGFADAEERQVKYSLERLTRVQRALERAVGADGQVFGIDVRRNRVEVRTFGDKPQRQDEIKRASAEAPDAVVNSSDGVPDQTTACSFPWCDAPLRGGVGMIISGALECTAGFNTRGPDGVSFVLTAGHCLAQNPLNTSWYTKMSGGSIHALGVTHNYTALKSDAGIIRLANPAGWSPAPRVVVFPGNGLSANDNYGIAGAALSSVGNVVCRTGAKTGSSCGEITEVGYTSSSGTEKLAVVRGGVCSVKGDSGGPWFASERALGLQVGTTQRSYGCANTYQGVTEALNLMGVSLRTLSNP